MKTLTIKNRKVLTTYFRFSKSLFLTAFRKSCSDFCCPTFSIAEINNKTENIHKGAYIKEY